MTRENSTTGVYGVVRVGISLDTNARLGGKNAARDTTFQSDTDYKRGFNGEIGVGYDTGPIRLEGTVGHMTAGLDKKKAQVGGFIADGRAKALTFGASAYLDIDAGKHVIPYVGGGIGASRVDARLSRLSGSPTIGSRYRDKDWGFNWHLDAGLGIKAATSTTIELGARYTRTSGLRLDGFNGSTKAEFRPRLSGWSAMVGLRRVF